MTSWLGQYFLHGDNSVEATVLVLAKRITIGYVDSAGAPVSLSWDFNQVDSYFDFSRQSSILVHRQQQAGRLVIPGKEAAELVASMQAELQRPWYSKEKSRDWGRYGLILTLFLAGLVISYFLMVPWMAEKMASGVSVQTEEQLGDAAYDALSAGMMEDQHATTVVNEFFQALHVTTPYDIRITVVRGRELNAFALPGGRIVVYRELLDRLDSYPQLAALLSHEFIHVNNRHSTKSIFRKFGSRVFLGLLFGKVGSVANVVADQADNLKSLTYSRKLEKEADMEGLALLKERKIDPAGFVALFEKLKRESGSGPDLPEFLGSHPDLDNRIDYIRNASVQTETADNTALGTIFAKLKNNH